MQDQDQKPAGNPEKPDSSTEPSSRPTGGTIALVGRPNVGKSTLLNRLAQEKAAIVTPVPQTTRNVIPVHWSTPAGKILILDTPGIHKPQHLMNRRMVRSAFQAMRGADLLAVMTDAHAGIGPGDRFVIRAVSELEVPLLLLLNKVDRIRKSLLLPQIEELAGLADFREIIPLSALHGDNCDRLQDILLRYLTAEDNYPDDTAQTVKMENFQAGEIIREKIFLATRQEIPHSTAVLIDRREDRDSGIWLFATLLVERDSQKPILIGKQGKMLREVGEKARLELEERWGKKVILKLWVRSQEGWRGNETILAQIGLPTDR